MAIINKILLIASILTIFAAFSYGQSSDLGTVCAESRELYGVDGFDNSEFIWSVDGGVIVDGDGEDTIEVQWGYNTGKYRMEVVELTEAGCLGLPSMGDVSVTAPLVDLGFSFYEICNEDSVIFDATGNYVEPYIMRWQNNTFAPSYIAKETELIWVKVTDGNGCVRYDTVDFTVHSLPRVNLGNDTVLCDREDPLILDVGNFAAYHWTSSSGAEYFGNPQYIYPNETFMDTITVAVMDNNNCMSADTLVLLPCSIAELFKDMPNTFTPNDDQSNETWVIPYMNQFPDAVLEIFDRWGRLVYRTEHVFEEPWDGTSKGRSMPMDAYYFVLDIKFLNFEPFSGTINLIK